MAVAQRPNNVVLFLPYRRTVDQKATTNFLQIKKVLDNLFFNNITFTGNLTITGSLVISGNLDVGGNTTFGGLLFITGTTDISGPTTFSAAVTFTNTVDMTKNLIVNPTVDPGTFLVSVINTFSEASISITATTADFLTCNTTAFAILNSGQIKTGSANESVGLGTATIGAVNCPAVTPASVHTWLSFTQSDGSQLYVPAWK